MYTETYNTFDACEDRLEELHGDICSGKYIITNVWRDRDGYQITYMHGA